MDWSTIIGFDKQLLLFFNGSDSLFLDGMAKTLTTASTWIPLYAALLYLVIKNNNSLQKVMLIIGCAALCVVLAGSLNDLLVKPWVCRWRPSRDPEIAMLVDSVNGYRGGDYGFFSSHAANTFSIAIFFTLLIRSKTLSVALILWSLVNCWTRMYLGVHFPGDILCGLVWGGAVGTGMWYLHQYLRYRIDDSKTYISTEYTPAGYQLADVQVVMLVLTLTLLYAIVRSVLFIYQ
jgi:undecaprenyl-diphosphatase